MLRCGLTSLEPSEIHAEIAGAFQRASSEHNGGTATPHLTTCVLSGGSWPRT